jgi:predicted secreted protein
VGFVLMLAIYAVIIWATQFAFAPVGREKKADLA